MKHSTNRLTQALALVAISTSLWSGLREPAAASQDEVRVRKLTLVDAEGKARMTVQVDPISGQLQHKLLDGAGQAQATTRVEKDGRVSVAYGSLGSGLLGAKPAIEMRVDHPAAGQKATSLFLGSSQNHYSAYFTANPEIGAMGLLGSLEDRATVLGVGTRTNGMTVRDKGVTRIEATQNGPVTGIAIADRRGNALFGSATQDTTGRFTHFARQTPGQQLWKLLNDGMALKSVLDSLGK